MNEEKDIWKFDKVGKRNGICYSQSSISHPAKMELNMCRKIIRLYSKKGDVILDPMGGIGSVLIEGVLLGRNVIMVEYEQKFCKMAEENLKLVNKHCSYFKSLGKGIVIKGDSRELSKLVNENPDIIAFSPPFGQALEGAGMAKKEHKDHIKVYGNIDRSKGNIETLPHGEISAIVTSPPFHPGHIPEELYKKGREQGILNEGKSIQEEYSTDKTDQNQIGNITKKGVANVVITSPPYAHESITTGKEFHQKREIYTSRFNEVNYSDDIKNIGNQKGKTYLSEMYKIYVECFKILKKNGFLILVLKNFVRRGVQVRLDLDTIKLVQKSGFKLIRRHYREITNPSFWITNAIQKFEKKYPGKKHPYPLEEDILVFIKGGGESGNIDSVVMSPPFADREGYQDKEFRKNNPHLQRKNESVNYSDNKNDENQIANLKY